MYQSTNFVGAAISSSAVPIEARVGGCQVQISQPRVRTYRQKSSTLHLK